MNTRSSLLTRSERIERRLLEVRCDVWWSRQDDAYIAFSAQYPGLVCADPWSSLGAINRLENEIRRVLMLEPIAA
ncbi:hypothetical protein [Nocardia seriolae]|uniref:Adenylosuccinate synthetase n=1 Tax=Nocardia seriolae TaxID=37332 RepID=A0A0B8NBG3_9NOCA|nr:hypothetical protein [Nocardia seriolae]APA98169.1 hypothetical protein NS506_04121 [Nocardia seriolae]MTJ62853.1 hypothetical protein [Nocardia seriolae]MTJ73413.1 hypothetical protein [Nocardia seriolae]MTJ87888.1 hypothetical protein [Nocardia seriolae]MTK31880.1 hypothetical protein [Nocardia seriolae]